LFDQLPLKEYKAEYYPKWGSPYIYDIYFKINGKEYLVEWDGKQHFDKRDVFGTSFEERQAVDNIKNQLAQENNVHLIRIDCSESDCNYIKNNIERSELSILFDLSKINWDLCNERAQGNLVKMVCDAWMDGVRSFEKLSEQFHLSNWTVRNYINRGVQLGWCDYNSDLWRVNQCHPIRVVRISDGQEYLFESLKECSVGTIDICGHKIAEETIKKYCDNRLPYKGFLFTRTDTTIQN
jgi:hypothetical protein